MIRAAKIREKNIKTSACECPICGGTGRMPVMKDVSDLYGENEDGTPKMLVFYADCECRGGIAAYHRVKERSNLPASYYDATLADFSWSIYGNADLTRQEKVVQSFVDNFTEWERRGLGLYIYSRTRGSGKTFLASAICNELMKHRTMTTKFVRVGDLLNIAQAADKSAMSEYEKDPVGLLCNCKLLVLDDLAQKQTGAAWLEDILFRITDSRMQKKLPTVVTSNVSLDALQLDDRIADRLYRTCQQISLPEVCIRSREANAEKTEFLKEIGVIDYE